MKDWHLIIVTVTITSIAVVLLLLGTAIPQLRGDVTITRDSEHPDGLTVRHTIVYACD